MMTCCDTLLLLRVDTAAIVSCTSSETKQMLAINE